MILTQVGINLSELTDNELMELYEIPNMNSISRNDINLELIKRLPLTPK